MSTVFQRKLHPLTSRTFELVKSASRDDETIQQLISQLLEGFPEEILEVRAEVKEFWRYRDKLSIVDGVLLCEGAVVVPVELSQGQWLESFN